MDHGHAHPSHDPSPANLANSGRNRQQTPNRSLSCLVVPNTSSPLRRSAQTPFETPLSLPQRRLQLRNAGFRAPRLPSHRLSTRISRWFSDRDEHNSQRRKSPACNRENSPPTVRRRVVRGSHTPSSILQEITNSTRSRYSEKSAFVPIYEEDQDDSPTHSWYHDAPSTQQSPIAFNTVSNNADEMKLREISGNMQRSPPPLSSPLARQVRGRNKRSLNLRKTSFPASEHIVFLETKLEESEKSQYSPNTGLPLKDKVKALTTENKRLQEMLAELEHQFETRLRDSVEHKTGLEMNLRRKIKQLEQEVGSKDCKIRDLEYRNDLSQRDLSNVDSWKAAVERLESEKRGLDETNRSLEKRNDVLTELLGQSPTRSHHGFEFPSPVRDHHKRTPRPRSMMPRIPSSPSRSESNRPLSLHTSPSPFQHDYFSPISALIREHDHPCNRGDVDPQKVIDDSQSIDSGLGESCSVHSGNEPMSKRSSMHSYASASPAAWGLPLPPSPAEDITERSSRKRKTRRFASGSTQLKPLVLPTLNLNTSLPQSAPLAGLYSDLERRDISERSIDPTISFISQHYETSTQPMRRSKAWAAEDALKALEGTSEVHYVSHDRLEDNHETSQSTPESTLTFQDLRNYSDYNSDPTVFTRRSIDEVILEEGSTAFLSHQVEDAGDQSFSSLAGEVSITESDIDRARAEEQILTTQFLESELPRSISLQLPNFPELPYPMEETRDANDTQWNPGEDETVSEPIFSPTINVRQDFANPLVSPYILPSVSFQHNETSSLGERPSNLLDEQGDPSTRSSSFAHLSERPVQTQSSCTGIGRQTAEMVMPNPLKAAPAQSGHKRPKRPHSPLELLQRRGGPTIPLTSVNNRTIIGTISRYTSYMREIRRDPTALARRVIANAWCSNWKRLGKLSWWVLGLFLGPGWKQKVEKRQGWEAYDGENIAQAEHERMNGPGPSLVKETRQNLHLNRPTPRRSRGAQRKRVECVETRETRLESQNEAQGIPDNQCKNCEQRSKASWGKSLYLWGKFSVAIMLAVGGAVIKGPEEMLKDCDLHSDDSVSETRSEHVRDRHDTGQADQNTLSDHFLDIQDNYDEEQDGNDNDDGYDGVDGGGVSRLRLQTQKPDSKSLMPYTSTLKRKSLCPPLLPTAKQDKYYTFGVPSTDAYDHVDDNGQCRPSRSRAPPARVPNTNADLGTLQWMQNLSATDFEGPLLIHDLNNDGWDGGRDRTIRAARNPPRRRGAKGGGASVRG